MISKNVNDDKQKMATLISKNGYDDKSKNGNDDKCVEVVAAAEEMNGEMHLKIVNSPKHLYIRVRSLHDANA